MTCHLCVGFCEEAARLRKHVSLFDGDYEIEQALARSRELPDSVVATELRMFLLIEIGHILIKDKYLEIAETCGIDGLTDTPWLKVKPVMSATMLTGRGDEINAAIETFDTLRFESRIRRSGSGHNTAELFDSGMLVQPLTIAMAQYRGVVGYLEISLRRSSRVQPHNRHYAYECGKLSAAMFDNLGFSAQDYVWITHYLHNVTETETIDPWTTPLPFLGLRST